MQRPSNTGGHSGLWDINPGNYVSTLLITKSEQLISLTLMQQSISRCELGISVGCMFI